MDLIVRRRPISRRRAVTLMICGVIDLIAGLFLLAMGIGYLVAYAVQGESAFKYFDGTNPVVFIVICIAGAGVASWAGLFMVRRAKNYLSRLRDVRSSAD